MDRKALIEEIKAANRSWSTRVRSELHDFQYDRDADILYLVFGKPGECFSFPLDIAGEDIYLRVEADTFRVVGIDIPCFRQAFLPRHPDGQDAFAPLLELFGNMDWRIQLKLPSSEGPPAPVEVAIFIPAARASLEYFPTYIPKVAPELVPA